MVTLSVLAEGRNDPKSQLAMGNTLRFTAMFLPFYVLLPIPVAFLIDRLVRGHILASVHSVRRVGPVARVGPFDDVGILLGAALAAAARGEESGCGEKRCNKP